MPVPPVAEDDADHSGPPVACSSPSGVAALDRSGNPGPLLILVPSASAVGWLAGLTVRSCSRAPPRRAESRVASAFPMAALCSRARFGSWRRRVAIGLVLASGFRTGDLSTGCSLRVTPSADRWRLGRWCATTRSRVVASSSSDTPVAVWAPAPPLTAIAFVGEPLDVAVGRLPVRQHQNCPL